MPDKTISFTQKFIMIIGGFSIAIFCATAILMLFPDLIPTLDPQRDDYAEMTLQIDFFSTDGDLYLWYQRGRIRPPENDAQLSSHIISWDEDGFRIPARQSDHYPIVIFGDSFVEGVNVARPWPDILADLLDTPTYNYGFRGFSPSDIGEVAQEFIPEEERDWVLYAHFSGNDIAQTQSSRTLSDALDRFEFILEGVDDRLEAAPEAEEAAEDADKYFYPLPVIIGDKYYEMAFLESYMWWQIEPEDGFEDSYPFNALQQTLDEFDAVISSETCKALIFIPVKAQLYYPYIYEGSRKYILDFAYRPSIKADGHLKLSPYEFEDEDELIESLTDQRDAMRDLASANGWYFIDLLEPFAEAVANGELLYYRYDTHWNQAGHELAAQTIKDLMDDHPDCSHN